MMERGRVVMKDISEQTGTRQRFHWHHDDTQGRLFGTGETGVPFDVLQTKARSSMIDCYAAQSSRGPNGGTIGGCQ